MMKQICGKKMYDRVSLENIKRILSELNEVRGSTTKQIISYLRQRISNHLQQRDLTSAVRRVLWFGLAKGALTHCAGRYKVKHTKEKTDKKEKSQIKKKPSTCSLCDVSSTSSFSTDDENDQRYSFKKFNSEMFPTDLSNYHESTVSNDVKNCEQKERTDSSSENKQKDNTESEKQQDSIDQIHTDRIEDLRENVNLNNIYTTVGRSASEEDFSKNILHEMPTGELVLKFEILKDASHINKARNGIPNESHILSNIPEEDEANAISIENTNSQKENIIAVNRNRDHVMNTRSQNIFEHCHDPTVLPVQTEFLITNEPDKFILVQNSNCFISDTSNSNLFQWPIVFKNVNNINMNYEQSQSKNSSRNLRNKQIFTRISKARTKEAPSKAKISRPIRSCSTLTKSPNKQSNLRVRRSERNFSVNKKVTTKPANKQPNLQIRRSERNLSVNKKVTTKPANKQPNLRIRRSERNLSVNKKVTTKPANKQPNLRIGRSERNFFENKFSTTDTRQKRMSCLKAKTAIKKILKYEKCGNTKPVCRLCRLAEETAIKEKLRSNLQFKEQSLCFDCHNDQKIIGSQTLKTKTRSTGSKQRTRKKEIDDKSEKNKKNKKKSKSGSKKVSKKVHRTKNKTPQTRKQKKCEPVQAETNIDLLTVTEQEPDSKSKSEDSLDNNET